LFISWLGTGFINMGWLAFFGAPLWGGLFISIGWFIFVFRYV
jgi:predicted small integral membrane protein